MGMSSGNHGQRVGFNESGKPRETSACATFAGEDRTRAAGPSGLGVFWAGLCVTCGRATKHADASGLPRHLPP
jgi:hypothetical protein